MQTNEKLEMNPITFLARYVHLESRWLIAAKCTKLQCKNIRVYKSKETFSNQVVQSQRDKSAKLEATRRCADVHSEEQSRVDVHSATQEQS